MTTSVVSFANSQAISPPQPVSLERIAGSFLAIFLTLTSRRPYKFCSKASGASGTTHRPATSSPQQPGLESSLPWVAVATTSPFQGPIAPSLHSTLYPPPLTLPILRCQVVVSSSIEHLCFDRHTILSPCRPAEHGAAPWPARPRAMATYPRHPRP